MAIKETVIRFDGDLDLEQVPLFRGSVIGMNPEADVLHNHYTDSSSVYRYPLVQYKSIDGQPVILGIDEGADILERMWDAGRSYRFRIGKEYREWQVLSKSASVVPLMENPGVHHRYLIQNWLPFNQDNYEIYRNTGSLMGRVALLDRILLGNILSLYKGFGRFFIDEIQAYLCDIDHMGEVNFKGTRMVSMDVIIETDVKLPVMWGLGKGVSRGLGVIREWDA